MIRELIGLFIVSFLLNMVWEFSHCRLYKTCLKMPAPKKRKLLTVMSLKDAFYIVLFYSLTVVTFGSMDVLRTPQLAAFVFLGLGFSFFDERVSLKMKRWEYTKKMPLVMGVGLTPLLEIAVTGTVALMITTLIL